MKVQNILSMLETGVSGIRCLDRLGGGLKVPWHATRCGAISPYKPFWKCPPRCVLDRSVDQPTQWMVANVTRNRHRQLIESIKLGICRDDLALLSQIMACDTPHQPAQSLLNISIWKSFIAIKNINLHCQRCKAGEQQNKKAAFPAFSDRRWHWGKR